MVISETAYANDGFFNGGSGVSIGELVMRRCACSDHNNGGNSGTVGVDVDSAVA